MSDGTRYWENVHTALRLDRKDCKRCRKWPAVLGGLCGLCRGREMASRSGELPAVTRPVVRRER